MKLNFTILLLLMVNFIFSQNIEKIEIPKGIVYNYCDSKSNELVKSLITQSITQKNVYKMLQDNLIIGPTLWKRLKEIKNLQNIPGTVIFHIEGIEVDGKMCRKIEDSKKVWDEIKKEISDSNYKIRKINVDELKYYWSVISFDIEEPLLILETENHHYILNFLVKEKKLFWIDEFPIKKIYQNPFDNTTPTSGNTTKSYKNGKEVYITDKGKRETKLEKIVFLSNDSTLKANISVKEVESIFRLTNEIFTELFKNSLRSGKIMIQFELKKETNTISFAVRDDLDLDIMNEFENRINNTKYPNSKNDPIMFQLIYKVNSFDDTE